MAKNVDDHIFIIIGGVALTLQDIGPAADMKMCDGFQHIIDAGLLGEHLKGQPWHEIIKSSGMRLEGEPNEEDTLVHTLYIRYQTAMVNCKSLSEQGLLTQAHKDEMMKLRREWRAAEKLSKS